MVSVLLGNGDGSFGSPLMYNTGAFAAAVAIGDFNQDGNADLVAVNNGNGNVSVLLGNGDGTFQSAQNYAAGSAADTVAVGDFNGDGFPELSVGTGYGVTVLLNAADWSGTAPRRSAVGRRPVDLLFAELAIAEPAAVFSLPGTGADPQPACGERSGVALEMHDSAPRGPTPIPVVRGHALSNMFNGWANAVIGADAPSSSVFLRGDRQIVLVYRQSLIAEVFDVK
jgi:hypothetical protein